MESDRTVFVVMMDGDRAVGDSLRALIDSIGYTVRVYGSGEDFRSAHKPSLRGCLVIDLNPSDRSAVQFIENLFDAGFDMPIIVTTEYDPAVERVWALPAGVVALLQRPFLDELLADTIERALAANPYA